jgi:hypothetical protein
MKPCIEVFLNVDAATLAFHHWKEGDTSPLKSEMPLAQLQTMGLEQAIQSIGTAIINVMTLWHPAEMAKYNGLRVPYDASEDLFLISGLIDKSIQKKTKSHLGSIELLVGEVVARDPMCAQDATILNWPRNKARIQQYPG